MGVDGAMDGDGRVDGRGRGCGRKMVERSVGGLMLLHASRKNVIARVELSGAYMTVLGVQNVCNV